MKFFENFFAAAYRCYDHFGEPERNKAASFVFIWLMGFSLLLFSVTKKIFGFDLSRLKYHSEVKLSITIFGFFLLGLIWKYYSINRTAEIIKVFEKKIKGQRRFWGYFSVLSLLLSG